MPSKQPLADEEERTKFPNAMPAFRTVSLSMLLLLAACAKTDVGATCHLQDAAGANLTPQPGRQYLFLGSSECQSFACVATNSTSSPYCSQACTGVGSSCPSGLVCQELAIDQQYLATLQTRLPPAQFQQMFGQMGSSFYCVQSQ
jgi:hypothetical protein